MEPIVPRELGVERRQEMQPLAQSHDTLRRSIAWGLGKEIRRQAGDDLDIGIRFRRRQCQHHLGSGTLYSAKRGVCRGEM